MKIEIIGEGKKKSGEIEINSPLLDKKLNKAVLYQAVKTVLAGRHHGTVRTKTRAEVNFTGKKSQRQKGTGNARHGSKKTAPFVGGGRVFGPKPRSYALGLPKKVKKLAIAEAFKHHLINNTLVVVNDWPLKEIKTKKAVDFLKSIDVSDALVILADKNESVAKSVRNIKGFKVASLEQVNVYDVLRYSKVVCNKDTLTNLKDRYFNEV